MKKLKKKKLLFYLFFFNFKCLFFSYEKINSYLFNDRITNLKEADYFSAYFSYYNLNTNYTKIRTIFTNEIANMTRIAGKFIFEGYYTEDMITPKIR